jgi:uncharacterized protein YjbJ (UPF0337 family)
MKRLRSNCPVQESFGSTTGNRSQEAKGKRNQAEGAMQDMYGQAKEVASEAADVVTRVAAEVALHVLAYNLTRVMNIIGIQPLLAAMRA